MSEKKRQILLLLVRQMREVVTDASTKEGLNHIIDTIAHTAPEILDSRWNRIFNFCRANLSNNKECFNLYNHYFDSYKKLVDM